MQSNKSDNVYQMSGRFKVAIAAVVLEGLLSGCNFLVLFRVLHMIFDGTADLAAILQAAAFLAGVFVLRLALYIAGYTGSQLGGADVSRRVRIAIGDKLKRIPLGLFTKNRTGFYINAATSEVADHEQILTHKTADIAKNSILLLAVGLYACTLYLPVGALMLLSSLFLAPAMAFTIRLVHLYGHRKNLAREENVSAITEYLAGSQTLRSYGAAGQKNEALTKAMREYSEVSYNYEKVITPVGFGFSAFSYLALAADMVLTTRAMLAGTLSPAALVLLIMLPLLVAKLNQTLFVDMTSYRNLLISKEKLDSILAEQEENASPAPFAPKSAEIRFDGVDFSYVEDEPVLQKASFTIRPHALTAIVGDSGSGKSTILNLIAHYYTPTGGRITIGGCDTAAVPSEKILQKISMVDQDVFLFNDTVKNNIRYARPEATDAEIEEACRLANCDGFIRAMAQGYDAVVGENGSRLSGGERQRLSIARAILKDSPILLLDEATASLDIENELAVKRAISNLLKADKTVVMIAHTLSIIRNAELILVVSGGRVAEAGSHRELLAQNGRYAAMWNAEQRLLQ